MMSIALTGSIGMGKSTVARMFHSAGIPVFDADSVVRDLQGHNGALLEAIGARFPGTVRGGILDRDELARAVFSDADELAALEAIVHPAVRAAREAFFNQNRDAPALLFEIPLLFETGQEAEFDKVIVVSAPANVQRTRALQRAGMTAEKLEAILHRQLPDKDKRERADYVVDTGADLSTTQSQVDEIIACLGLAGRG